jgi:sterol desaturase/sphingolipid hydroxylase (fatty acid hydroxylase superfamily)
VKLSSLAYYLDFVAAPVAVAFLIAAIPYSKLWSASLGFALGIALWSLAEYVVHRFVYHRVQPFKRLHDAHHAHSEALIGAPPVVGPAIVLFSTMPLVHVHDGLGLGTASGALFGYFAYILIHHEAHHQSGILGPWFRALRRNHLRHHAARGEGNFGIVTPFWDRLFGTSITKDEFAKHKLA